MAARAGAALLGLALLAAPAVLTPYQRALALAILADVVLAVAWAFFSGPTRYLSLASGAFFGAGAYVTAVAGGTVAWPLPVVLGGAVAAVMAGIVGVLALRLHGPYFAVFTFGLAELAKHVLIWYETRVTGTIGRILLAQPAPAMLYYTVLALAGLAVATAVLLRRSRWGAALVGIGGDEERAETLGVNTTALKVAAFALSAAFIGAAGAAMAPRWTYLDPNVFNPLVSFQAVIMALLGGASTVAGPVVGAVFLGLASEILLVKFRYAYMLGLGAVLLVVVLALPEGLAGLWGRRYRSRSSA